MILRNINEVLRLKKFYFILRTSVYHDVIFTPTEVAMLLWLFVFMGAFSLFWHDVSVSAAARIWLLIADTLLLCMLSFALLGIRGTAKLPLGVQFLQIFFGRGQNAWNAVKASWQMILMTGSALTFWFSLLCCLLFCLGLGWSLKGC